MSDRCTFSAGTSLEPSLDLSAVLNGIQVDEGGAIERLEPYTVIHGASSERREWDGKSQESEDNLRVKHLEYLREILPK